jgi:hypothetical protein
MVNFQSRVGFKYLNDKKRDLMPQVNMNKQRHEFSSYDFDICTKISMLQVWNESKIFSQCSILNVCVPIKNLIHGHNMDQASARDLLV